MSRLIRLCLSLGIIACTTAAASAQVKLQFKFPENREYRVEEKSNVDQVLTIAGMEVPTKSEQSSTSLMKFGAKRADGSIPLTETIESAKVQLELPGGINLSIDSADQGAPPADELPQLKPLREIIKALAGASYIVVFDDKGKIKAIEGSENAIKNADALDPDAADGIKKRFLIDRLKKNNEDRFGMFPDTLLRPGDTWERTHAMEIGGGQTLTFQRKFEYIGPEQVDGRMLDKVGVKATSVTYMMEPTPNAQVTIPKSDLKIDSSEGTILFDREEGRLVSSKIKTRIVGDLTLVAGGMELESKLDLTLDSESRLKPVKD